MKLTSSKILIQSLNWNKLFKNKWKIFDVHVYQDHPDMNFRKTALYLLLLLRERKGTILESMRLAQGLIHSGYLWNNEEHSRVARSLSRVRGAVIVAGYNAPIVNALHPAGRVTPLPPGERGSIFISPRYYDVDWFVSLLNTIPGVSFKVYRVQVTRLAQRYTPY